MRTFETTVPIRYRDLDPMGHVNNAVYATYVETAREAFFRQEVGRSLARTDAALAALSVEFHAPIRDDGAVLVETVVTDVGETSCTFDHRLRVDGDRVADAETTLVTVADGDPRPLPDDVREAVERFHVDRAER